ncbi:UNVERIFIED_CONTAM: hypothetical protein FKN15_076645 [Acipenser sinensis]
MHHFITVARILSLSGVAAEPKIPNNSQRRFLFLCFFQHCSFEIFIATGSTGQHIWARRANKQRARLTEVSACVVLSVRQLSTSDVDLGSISG